LSRKYSEDPERFAYIEDMIEHEVCTGESTIASDSLLWLKRVLHFIYLFLRRLVIDHERNERGESLLENMRVSYELSLKPYHNWMLQKLFMILCRAAPTRQELINSMSNYTKSNCGLTQDDVMAVVKVFVDGLHGNLAAIFELYVRLRLDSQQFTCKV